MHFAQASEASAYYHGYGNFRASVNMLYAFRAGRRSQLLLPWLWYLETLYLSAALGFDTLPHILHRKANEQSDIHNAVIILFMHQT